MKEMSAVNKRILLIPILLFPFSSCSNKEEYPPVYEYRVNSVYKTIREEFFELHKEEINEYYDNDEYRQYINASEDWHPSSNDLTIEFSWGVYNDTYVVSMSFGRSVYPAVWNMISETLFHFGEQEVYLLGSGLDGGKFSPQNPNFKNHNLFFIAYNNHNFYWLEEAYQCASERWIVSFHAS